MFIIYKSGYIIYKNILNTIVNHGKYYKKIIIYNNTIKYNKL